MFSKTFPFHTHSTPHLSSFRKKRIPLHFLKKDLIRKKIKENWSF